MDLTDIFVSATSEDENRTSTVVEMEVVIMVSLNLHGIKYPVSNSCMSQIATNILETVPLHSQASNNRVNSTADIINKNRADKVGSMLSSKEVVVAAGITNKEEDEEEEEEVGTISNREAMVEVVAALSEEALTAYKVGVVERSTVVVVVLADVAVTTEVEVALVAAMQGEAEVAGGAADRTWG